MYDGFVLQIEDEQKTLEDDRKAKKKYCKDSIAASDNILSKTSKDMSANHLAVKDHRVNTIPNNRKWWEEHKKIEDDTQATWTTEKVPALPLSPLTTCLSSKPCGRATD